MPEAIVKLGEATFDRATFNANVTLPDSIEDIGEYAFVRSTWNNNAVLVKLPNSLKVLYGSALMWDDKTGNYAPIPLASDFTLENTKLERIEDDGVWDAGTFNGYQLPANFRLPKTIKYIGTSAFKDADFSLLPGKKIVIPNYEIEINPESGLTSKNMAFISNDTLTQANNAQIKTKLLSPANINHKEDENTNTIY